MVQLTGWVTVRYHYAAPLWPTYHLTPTLTTALPVATYLYARVYSHPQPRHAHLPTPLPCTAHMLPQLLSFAVHSGCARLLQRALHDCYYPPQPHAARP